MFAGAFTRGIAAFGVALAVAILTTAFGVAFAFVGGVFAAALACGIAAVLALVAAFGVALTLGAAAVFTVALALNVAAFAVGGVFANTLALGGRGGGLGWRLGRAAGD